MGLVVDWASPDPGALGARLADRLRLPRPDPDADRFALQLAGGILRVARAAPGDRERLVAVSVLDDRLTAAPGETVTPTPGHGSDSPPDHSHPALGDPPGVRLLGVAWATVEMARGIRELAERSGLDAAAFELVDDDAWLGATARVARLGRSSLVVLEPTTEGRVAAALARFGEGPVAVYLALPGPASGSVRHGPLGAGALMAGWPAWGPFAIVVADPAEAPEAPSAGASAAEEQAQAAPTAD